mmetsp:Transcript_67988/g.128409  ORF Transcript_67988/g.128409 Transcript_67988/m.128409 type:complete len:168 (+) Transcript_67988:3-506(+)
MIMDEDRSGSVSYVEFVNNMYKMKQQDVNTLLMFIKGYVVDLRIKMKEDVVILQRKILNQQCEFSNNIESVIKNVESLVNSLQTSGLPRESTNRSLPSEANLSELERNLTWAISEQSADILRAIGNQTSAMRSYQNSGTCTPQIQSQIQGLCSRPKLLPPTLLPRGN